MALITLDHITKVYPRSTRPALNDVTLSIDRGEFVFLVGASGSGKTTLLSLLLAEEDATEGEIRVAGNDLRRIPNRQIPRYRRSIGFVFQDYKLLENKTVWQNVAFALEVLGHSRSTIKSLVPQALKTVGLTGKEERLPQELSGGEAQRVAIARAYVNHPQIILADEPTGNLDPTTSVGIMEVLEAVNRTGTTVVMATHNEEIVNSMRKRVIELHEGVVVRDEQSGSYDSSVYYPDADVESAALDANGRATIRMAREADADEQNTVPQVAVPDPAAEDEGLAGLVQMAADSSGTAASGPAAAGDGASQTAGERTGDFRARARAAAPAQSAYRGTEDSYVPMTGGSPSSGIARLAQSVHSGRTGRYGEAFAPVEDTLTWGKGLPKVVGRHGAGAVHAAAYAGAANGTVPSADDVYDRFRRHDDGSDAATEPIVMPDDTGHMASVLPGTPTDGTKGTPADAMPQRQAVPESTASTASVAPSDSGDGTSAPAPEDGVAESAPAVPDASPAAGDGPVDDTTVVTDPQAAASSEGSAQPAASAATGPATIPAFLRETESWTPIAVPESAGPASGATAGPSAHTAGKPARVHVADDDDLNPPLPPMQPETMPRPVAAVPAEPTAAAQAAQDTVAVPEAAAPTVVMPSVAGPRTEGAVPAPRHASELQAQPVRSMSPADDSASASASASGTMPAAESASTPVPAHEPAAVHEPAPQLRPHAPVILPEPDLEQAAKAMPGMAAALASLAAEAQGAANVDAAVSDGWLGTARSKAGGPSPQPPHPDGTHENANKNKGGRH